MAFPRGGTDGGFPPQVVAPQALNRTWPRIPCPIPSRALAKYPLTSRRNRGGSLLAVVAQLPDSSGRQGRRHSLPAMLTAAAHLADRVDHMADFRRTDFSGGPDRTCRMTVVQCSLRRLE